ncbi:DUF3305 domain-containing protein [Oceaniglobus roseus]|uniref:DUF3305 domain-containing protein n=1 Tax=Oceaniglobus roseus TaxID=1737570 RepID=UPI001FE69DB8|nr:DUF3305 domain-containing protein [Kandeliimicrobium roseum]
MFVYPDAETVPVGIVVKRTPGVTRWAKWAWRATDVLPGAGPADWKVLRQEGETTLFHAATLPLTLYVSDTEAYAHELAAREPSIYVILRQEGSGPCPLEAHLVTASPYVAQDYSDSGEELVEKVAMPGPMHAWISAFVEKHHREEAFVKRRRDRLRTDRTEDGVGDPRISQTTDVYRAPARGKAAS